MFNKKFKTRTWILIISLAFMSVIPGKAVGGFDPMVEEQSITERLRDYTDASFEVRWGINRILDEIEEEKPRWLICLPGGALTETHCPERGHSELYYLWLVEKFDKIFNFLNEDEITGLFVHQLTSDLLKLVFDINSKVYSYHEDKGWSAVKIRESLVGTPGYYNFEQGRD